ncbi:hypothetical protein J2I47_07045 [Fibrella sp. HMF5335]|uniref:Uncharacterized protein n=1 Tax=Fibrella rubiginis TaxID=2817060 RepID=A0A939GGC8_9BACT|nr:hypothetical protein [Fibrella rubiginis]MBO0936300.1 hypothetical protein [Fibrella rubiginis]
MTTADITDFKAAIEPRKFVRLEYLTDLHEFIKTDALVVSLNTQNGTETLVLADGQQIPLDRVISIAGRLSPLYPGYTNYSCDC